MQVIDLVQRHPQEPWQDAALRRGPFAGEGVEQNDPSVGRVHLRASGVRLLQGGLVPLHGHLRIRAQGDHLVGRLVRVGCAAWGWRHFVLWAASDHWFSGGVTHASDSCGCHQCLLNAHAVVWSKLQYNNNNSKNNLRL